MVTSVLIAVGKSATLPRVTVSPKPSAAETVRSMLVVEASAGIAIRQSSVELRASGAKIWRIQRCGESWADSLRRDLAGEERRKIKRRLTCPGSTWNASV